jgi:hypothetical protein
MTGPDQFPLIDRSLDRVSPVNSVLQMYEKEGLASTDID